MDTWRRGQRRTNAWRAPTFSEVHDLSAFTTDLTHIGASSVRTLRMDYQQGKMSGPAVDDDGHDYVMGRNAWADMMNQPKAEAARKLQPMIRGTHFLM